jgi:hypothetical protein
LASDEESSPPRESKAPSSSDDPAMSIAESMMEMIRAREFLAGRGPGADRDLVEEKADTGSTKRLSR